MRAGPARVAWSSLPQAVDKPGLTMHCRLQYESNNFAGTVMKRVAVLCFLSLYAVMSMAHDHDHHHDHHGHTNVKHNLRKHKCIHDKIAPHVHVSKSPQTYKHHPWAHTDGAPDVDVSLCRTDQLKSCTFHALCWLTIY